MNKSLKIYIFFLVLLLLAIIVVDVNKPKIIDWNPTYDIKDKIPFGMYVLDNELLKIQKNQKITRVSTTPYEYLNEKLTYLNDTINGEYSIEGTFLGIDKNNSIDKESASELCYFVEHGNDVFLSMNDFPNYILDSLHVELKSEYQYQDSTYFWMANKKLDPKKYKLSEGRGSSYFSKIDTLKTTILGYQSGDSVRVNFIKVPYKSGNFYLHTQPIAFTNFHLLKDNRHQYAENLLSYINRYDIFWLVKNQNGELISNNPFRFILSQPALRWAWFLFLGGTLVFMIFNAKRRQRIVPIIVPLENTTIEFAKTIGNLYYLEADHGNLMEKKITYFLEKLRQDYLMNTTQLDNDFVKRLHQKSGKDLESIKNIIYLIQQFRKTDKVQTENDLINLNKAIEKIIN